MIEQLSSYSDLMMKLEYDLQKFAGEQNVFHLLDCILTLNAIPEWVVSDTSTPSDLLAIAQDKLLIMKGQKKGFKFDVALIDSDINHMLCLIRLIANHSKHKTDDSRVPEIKGIQGNLLDAVLPMYFGYFLGIGDARVHASTVLERVSTFWKEQIAKSP